MGNVVRNVDGQWGNLRLDRFDRWFRHVPWLLFVTGEGCECDLYTCTGEPKTTPNNESHSVSVDCLGGVGGGGNQGQTKWHVLRWEINHFKQSMPTSNPKPCFIIQCCKHKSPRLSLFSCTLYVTFKNRGKKTKQMQLLLSLLLLLLLLVLLCLLFLLSL